MADNITWQQLNVSTLQSKTWERNGFSPEDALPYIRLSFDVSEAIVLREFKIDPQEARSMMFDSELSAWEED